MKTISTRQNLLVFVSMMVLSPGLNPAALAKSRSSAAKSPASKTSALKTSAIKDESGCNACLSQSASLFASNQLDKAVALLREWSERCPNNSKLHLLLSTILIRQDPKNLAEAEKEAGLACEAQADSQAAHLQYAMTLLAREKYSNAASEFETVTSLNPGSYEAWSALADLYKRLRRDQEAAVAAQKAAVLEPATQAVKLSVLKNLKKAGRLAQAKRELKKLLDESGSVPEFEQALAIEALQLGDYDAAIAASTEVLKAYPDSAGPLKCILFCEFFKHQYAEAEATANKILSSGVKSADTLSLLALCKLYAGNLSAAEEDVAKARLLDSSCGFALLADGICKQQKGDFEQALDQLKLASDSPDKGQEGESAHRSLAHLALARLNLKQGLADEAVQEAHLAARDKRFEAAALGIESRAIAYENKSPEANSKAMELARKAASVDAQDPDAIISLSFSHLRAGAFDEAAKLAARLTSRVPWQSDAYLLQALIADAKGDLEKRREELEKGLKCASKDPELLFELGRLNLKNNKAAEAVPLLKQALSVCVRGPEICFALAEAFEKSGDTGESLKYYKQSLKQGLSGDNSKQAKDAINRLESKN